MKTYFMWNDIAAKDPNLPDMPDILLDASGLKKGDLIELDYVKGDKRWVNARVTGVNYFLSWGHDTELTQWVWLEPYDDEVCDN